MFRPCRDVLSSLSECGGCHDFPGPTSSSPQTVRGAGHPRRRNQCRRVAIRFELRPARFLQVHTACDPFSGDVVLLFFTGPVTEGEFFASGSPFNVLNPGFVGSHPTTLTQTGLLFGVTGAFGGSPPAASGDGVLAYVEFLKVGTGPSDVTLDNPFARRFHLRFPCPNRARSRSWQLAFCSLAAGDFGGRPAVQLPRFRHAIRMRGNGDATSLLHRECSVFLVCAPDGSRPRADDGRRTVPGHASVGPEAAVRLHDDVSAIRRAPNWNSEAVLDRETGLVWREVARTTLVRWWCGANCTCTKRVETVRGGGSLGLRN